MPLQQIARKLPLRFHNHWIRPGLPDEELLQIGAALATPAAKRRCEKSLRKARASERGAA